LVSFFRSLKTSLHVWWGLVGLKQGGILISWYSVKNR
jgi:hypothetical protein